MADPLYTDVDDFFEITEGLPLQKKEEKEEKLISKTTGACRVTGLHMDSRP